MLTPEHQLTSYILILTPTLTLTLEGFLCENFLKETDSNL